MDLTRWTELQAIVKLKGMACRRENVDLMLMLENPVCARKYIADFDWNMPDPPKYIVYGIEEKIWFEKMTDEEAVLAAQIILRDVEIPQVWRTAQLEFWHH